MSIIIKMSDAIYLPASLPEDLLRPILNDLAVINPAYVEARKYNRSTTSIPVQICLYKKMNEYVRLPRGYLFHLTKMLTKKEIPFILNDETVSIETTYEMSVNLRDYQREAIAHALKYRQGVIISPCGSGKTVMGVCFIAMSKQKALWITHTKDLLYQTIKQVGGFLSISPENVGIIGDGSNRIGEKMTVALVQSLIHFDKEIIRKSFGTIVIDEAHRVPSKTFYEVVDISAAKYRLGLTATPKRKDGLESVLYRVVGQTVYRITEKDLLKEDQILIPQINKLHTNFECSSKNFQSLMKKLVEDSERNQFIVNKLKESLGSKDVALVLSCRVSHCHLLQKLIKTALPNVASSVLTGKTTKREREAILEGARQGHLTIIIATQVADEGLDIPLLSKLYLATPTKSKAKLKQQIGRIMRKVATKDTPIVYDFIDKKVPIFKRHANIRNIVYAELNCFYSN